MSTIVKKIYKIVNETVFPPKCLVCSSFIQTPEGVGNGFPGEADLSSTIQI